MKKTATPFVLALALLLVIPTGALWAQASGGAIQGRVVDASGAPVPNVQVQLENLATGQRLTAQTDADGQYRFESIQTGQWRVITGTGAAAAAPSREFTVDLGRSYSVNVTMSPAGPATDAVTSTETVPVDRSTAQIENTFNTSEIQYLPSSNFVSKEGTNFGAYNLSQLTEGVMEGGIGGRGPAVVGQRPASNSFHIDGVDNNKVVRGPLVYLSNEATSDFGLWQAQFAPEFGHAVGGRFNSVMRSGTNQVHGAIYNYFQNRNLNAMEPSAARLGLDENPRYDQNRLGASIGFPIIPSKLFMFGNFEYIPLGFTRFSQGSPLAPTAGGFQTLAGLRGVSATNLGILQSNLGAVGDPVGSTTVGGVAIPLGLAPLQNRGWQNQYDGSGSIDWSISHFDQLRARYVHNDVRSSTSGLTLPGFATPNNRTSLLASVAHYHTFSSVLTNELRLGFNRYDQNYPRGDFSFPGLSAFPSLNLGTDTNLMLGPAYGLAQSSIINTYHLADGVNWNFRNHNFRFGFDGRRYIGSQTGFASANGIYGYSSLERFLLDLPPDVRNERGFGSSYYNGNQWLLFGYIQDNWQVMPGLNVNMGVRYEYATIPTGIARQGLNSAAGVDGLISFREPRSETRNFAPNFGISWSPTRLTVLRGGFNMSYDALAGNYFGAPGIDPSLGTVAYGNLASATPGFLAGGGLRTNLDPTAEPGSAAARAGITRFFADQNLPYAMQWNFAVQQGIWQNFTAEVKYLGARNVNQPRFTLLNPATGVTAERNLPIFSDSPTAAQLNALNLNLNQLATGTPNAFSSAGFTSPIYSVVNDGFSTYHGAAVSLNHRFGGGFQMKGNYTWSHLIDDSTGTPLDLAFAQRVRADSILDRRHVANVTASWDIAPLFKDTYSVVRNVFANFTLSGIYNFSSGPWVTALAGGDPGFTGSGFGPAFINPNGTGNTGTGLTPLRNSAGQVVAYQARNPNARFIAGAPGTFGNVRRNSFQLDDTNNFDVAAVKRFSWRDRAAVEIRGEAFNVFNHPQFTGSHIGDIDFKDLTGSAFLLPSSSSFGDYRSMLSSNSRTLQLALRVTF